MKPMNTTTTPNDCELLPLGQIAARLQVHVSTLRRIWRAGLLPGYRIGYRTLRFRLAEVLDALKRQPNQAGGTS